MSELTDIFVKPYAPRPQPTEIPTADWNEEPLLCLQVNDQWAAHIYGVLDCLAQRDTWIGSEAEIDAAINNVDHIISALMEACVTPLDEKVKISTADTTADYLENKILAGGQITRTKNNTGGNESLTFSISPFVVGEVKFLAHASVPSGWLECNGGAVSRSTYAALFAAIGTKYGVGDGSTTFNVPMTKRKFIAGFEPVNGGDFDFGHTGGEETHVLTTTEMPSHSHAQRGQPLASGAGSRTALQNASGTAADSLNSTASTGGGAAHENRPPWVVFMPIIYAGV